MRYTGSGSVLTAAGGAYLVGSMTAVAITLVLGGCLALILAARRRRRDVSAIRRRL